jgi:hypothetical protein
VTALVASGCGSDLEEVTRGAIECGEPCSILFEQVIIDRSKTSDPAELLSTGDAPVLIRDIRLVDSSPYMRFDVQLLNSVDRLSEGTWVPNSTNTAFLPLEGDELVPFELLPRRPLEVTLSFGPTERDGLPFCPSGSNEFCGEVIIETNAENNPEIVIPVGLAIAGGDLVVQPNIVNFPEPVVGETFEECWEVVNNGTGQITVSSTSISVELSGQLSIESADRLPLPIAIQAGGRREFCGKWTPTTTAPLNVAVQFTANDTDPTNNIVQLRSGAGSSPTVTIEPCESISFEDAAVGETTEIPVEITNTSGVNVQLNSVTLLDVNPADARAEFDVLNLNGDTAIGGQQDPIAAEQSRVVNLVYTPTAIRSVTGSLRFGGNFAGAVRTCTFAAGPPSPEAEVVPTRLFWSGLLPGDTESRSFVINNRGRAPLEVTSIDLVESGDANDNEFALNASADTPLTVAAGGSYRVTVDFTRAEPDVSADDRAEVTVTTNDPVTPSDTVFLEANHGDTLLPPVCRIVATPGEPYEVGDTVTLDASSSEAPAGGAFVTSPFSWTLVGPAGSVARLSSTQGANVTLSFDAPGTYEVVMTATALIAGTDVTCESDPFNMLVLAP